jgi:LigT-like phosphoesterase
VNAAGSVGSDDSIRLFCALTLPDNVLDRLVEWQAHLPAGDYRPVGRDNLHVTLAFLGSRPFREVEPIRAELEAAAAGTRPIVLCEHRYRETRSVGMLVFDDEDRAAACTSRSVVRGCPISRSSGSASGRGSRRHCPTSAPSFRPVPLSTIPCSAERARSTLSFMQLRSVVLKTVGG